MVLFLFLSHLAGAPQPINSRKRDLLLCLVFASRFSECFRRLFDVEDIIYDLKRKADMFAVLRQGSQLFRACAGVDGAEANARAQERSGFCFVDGLQQRRTGTLALAFDIVHLATDHATDRACSAR